MRNLSIVFVLIVALFTIACNKSQTAKRTVIDGKIANFMREPRYNLVVLTVADFGGDPTTYKTTVNRDGNFKIYFEQYIAQDVSLKPLVGTFITHPGDSIHIDLDYAKYGDVKFSGDREESNTALTHYIGEYYSNFNLSEIYHNFASQQDKSDYQQVANATRTEMMRNRGDFIDKYQPNNEVLNWSKNYVDICYYQTFGRLFSSYVIANKVPASKSTVIAKNFVNSIDQDIYNTKLLNSDSYKIYGYLMPYHAVTNKHDNNEIIQSIAQAVEKSNRSPIVKQLLIGGIFYNILRKNEIEAIDKNRKLFDTDIKEPFIKAPLNKFYAQVKHNLANPKIASDATLKNISAGSAQGLINSIKAQNKGKVTYIDFWATWCGPCKKELPFSKKLMEKYKGKDVSFVFVCLDSPKDTWKANLAEMKLTGNQYFFDLKQSNEIRKAFKINGIPRYMIISKDGTITDVDATRPSDPITATKIDRLLN